jgi:TetR/AcrR family transcriptional regulator, transcriptional repressor for nem operon
VGRPKGYERDAALLAARDLFWEQGYERTSVADLEARTGLNRSSLYQEFGSKRQLFEAALECYADRVIANLLAGLRDDPDVGLDSVSELFRHLGELFRGDTAVSARGCMMVNATAELAARDDRVRAAAAAYRDRLRASFGSALATAAAKGEIAPGTAEARAHLLASALMGVWLSVRIDPADASDLCTTVADEVESWGRRARHPDRGKVRFSPQDGGARARG